MNDYLKYQNTQMILCDNLFMRARGLYGICQMKSRAFAVENCHLKTSPRKLGKCSWVNVTLITNMDPEGLHLSRHGLADVFLTLRKEEKCCMKHFEGIVHCIK